MDDDNVMTRTDHAFCWLAGAFVVAFWVVVVVAVF